MAKKIKDEVVDVDTLNRYLNEKSDFNFELKILNMMRGLNITCEHSGTYMDSGTGIVREFDIRAHASNENHTHLRMAVECKNLKRNNPLLVMCVKRNNNESFHHVVKGYRESGINRFIDRTFYDGAPDVVKMCGMDSLYPPSSYTGKSISQVAVLSNGNEISASDSDVFSKWTQCVASSVDLIKDSLWDYHNRNGDNFETISLILPILVIPDETLWSVKFDDDGNKLGDPELTNHVSVYIDRQNIIGENTRHTKVNHYCLSHIDIFTKSGLEAYLIDNEIFNNGLIKVIDRELVDETYLQSFLTE